MITYVKLVGKSKEKAMEVLERIRKAINGETIEEDTKTLIFIDEEIDKIKAYISLSERIHLYPSSSESLGELILLGQKTSFREGRKLEDIGTSEEELVELRKKAKLVMAKRSLETAREKDPKYTYHAAQVAFIRLKEGNIPPETIGTTWEELEKLEKEGKKLRNEYYKARYK